MKLIELIFSVLCTLLVVKTVKSYRILGMFPTTSKSHYYLGHAIFKALAKQGHDVTLISPFQAKDLLPNYKEIFLEESWELSRKTYAKDNFANMLGKNFYETTISSMNIGTLITNMTVHNKNFQKFLHTKQQFDVVIVEILLGDVFLALGKHFNAPVIALTAFASTTWSYDLVKSPIFPSYMPNIINPYIDQMTFFERMYNSFTFWFEEMALHFYYIPMQQQLMEETFPNTENWPAFSKIRQNISLVLINSHPTINTPRPYLPNMIDVGGLQINREQDALPLNVQTFLDEAEDGAIYISLGSNVLLAKLPEQQKNAIFNAFATYPNVRLLVKSDEAIAIPSHSTKNVLAEPWFSQDAVLAHPNIKIFITHGGLLSATESVHFGKPVIGIPFFFDQHMNMRLAEKNGHGISVPFESLTLDKLKSAVKNLLSDPRYAKNAKTISDCYRDQIQTPLETAVFWVNYVARHQGAPNLRSYSVELPFYALYNIDVFAFVLVVLAICCFVLFLVCRLFFCSSRTNVHNYRKKRE